ncbi:MAG: hypothetical protein AAF333_09615 [Planctomycetota bacterium]
MPLFETPTTARARVKAALRLCDQLDRSYLFVQTSIDEITARLEQMYDTLDQLCLQDLGLTEIERQLTSVRDTINKLNDSFEKEKDHAQTQR